MGNLIDNAIKYTDKGFVRVHAEEVNGRVIFKVEDSGPGISEERQKELFALTTSSTSKGAGIGLAIVKKVALALGGDVYLQTELGKGSTFCMDLPKSAPPKSVS